jgi:hypothetical protein
LCKQARKIQNKTLANKVIRNVKLTYYLLPKDKYSDAELDRYAEAALRVISKLSSLSKEELVNKFHVIHSKRE